MSSMTTFDIIIIGGGASGMMAAIQASRLKRRVVLIEKNAELGRKILATGNGRCNLTNKFAESNRYHGGETKFIEQVLKQFNQFETMKFFENLGLVLKEENLGRIFPRTDEAKTVVEALVYELQKNKVEIILNDQARRIEKIDDYNSNKVEKFKVTLQSNKVICAKKLVITTGGLAAPHLGTSGDAYFWLKNLGHTITPLFPALTPLETKETWVKEVQGLKIEAKISTSIDGKMVCEKVGDALFTHFGISGPAAMAQAGAIEDNIGRAPTDGRSSDRSVGDVKIHIDLFPQISEKELNTKIEKIIDTNGAKQIKNTLAGLISSNLAPIILNNLNINPEKKSAEISKIDRAKIAQNLKNIELTVTAVRPFREAQVTHGGVSLAEIDAHTLGSKIVPGLYLAGEILNVDGDSGGFNLQWAWASGFIAGKSAAF